MEVEEGSRRSDGDMAAAAGSESNEIGGGGRLELLREMKRNGFSFGKKGDGIDTACDACELLIRGWTARVGTVTSA